MKSFFFIFLLLPVLVTAQPAGQQLESIANESQADPEDDMYLQDLARFNRHPLNINIADKDELTTLHILTDLQLDNLVLYRRLLGPVMDIYELQAIPSWDIVTIRRLLPFITIGSPVSAKEDWAQRFKKGDHSLLLRIACQTNVDSARTYTGNPQKIFFRYKYVYKNLLQYGLAGDKDAGESFFGGAQKMGFDFYTFYLFARNTGIIEALALGDFTVNMGQGLIQWQSMAFKKSGDVMAIKRQAGILRPYNSAGEFNFMRGCGITIRKGKTAATAFLSFRKLSASEAVDTTTGQKIFSSFQSSGYHRTVSEIADRNNLGQLTIGGNVRYNNRSLQVGINAVWYHFSMLLEKKDEPYNLFALRGRNWYNASMDYSYTRKNIHFFGEAAIDRNFQRAVLNGLLISADPKVDISFVHRLIAKQYQAVNANAFTENTSPSNENGLYTGIALRPSAAWQWEAYMDLFKFPWLKYLVDAPSAGRDFLLQITYTPSRRAQIYCRYKTESKMTNETGAGIPVVAAKQDWRIHISYTINAGLSVRNRVEMVWYNKDAKKNEMGFMTYTDIICKPPLKPFSAQLRLQYFETGGYDSRVYSYENDVLYSYSLPVFSGRGYHYSTLISYDFSKRISCWLRWNSTVGTTNENELKVQVRYIFRDN